MSSQLQDVAAASSNLAMYRRLKKRCLSGGRQTPALAVDKRPDETPRDQEAVSFTATRAETK